jgi:hypothetical protein
MFTAGIDAATLDSMSDHGETEKKSSTQLGKYGVFLSLGNISNTF